MKIKLSEVKMKSLKDVGLIETFTTEERDRIYCRVETKSTTALSEVLVLFDARDSMVGQVLELDPEREVVMVESELILGRF